MEKGFVYILTNPSFREDWVKIGKSARPVNVRSKELDNTAVPLPFEIFATIETSMYHEVERLVHKMIDRLTDLRIRQNREFFNVSPHIALDIFRDIASTVKDATVVTYKANQPINPVKSGNQKNKKPEQAKPVSNAKKRGRFKFSLVGIEIGEELIFVPANLRVKVVSDDSVEYEDRIYKLSPFAGTFMPEELRNTSGAYQGCKYFTYQGITLDALRMQSETQKQNSDLDE